MVRDETAEGLTLASRTPGGTLQQRAIAIDGGDAGIRSPGATSGVTRKHLKTGVSGHEELGGFQRTSRPLSFRRGDGRQLEKPEEGPRGDDDP